MYCIVQLGWKNKMELTLLSSLYIYVYKEMPKIIILHEPTHSSGHVKYFTFFVAVIAVF